jgi:hypothetical protein
MTRIPKRQSRLGAVLAWLHGGGQRVGLGWLPLTAKVPGDIVGSSLNRFPAGCDWEIDRLESTMQQFGGA